MKIPESKQYFRGHTRHCLPEFTMLVSPMQDDMVERAFNLMLMTTCSILSSGEKV